MTSKFYKHILTFFNKACVLSIKFDGKTFSAPKSLRIKSIFWMSLVLILRNILKFIEKDERKTEVKTLSIFFLLFVGNMSRVNKAIPFICTFILIIQQDKIAKIFTKFYELKKFCDIKKIKIDDKSMSKRIKKSFFVFALVSVLLFDYMELMFKDNIKLITIIISIFDHILKTYYLLTLNFYYIILIHYEYLFKNLNQILENQTELIHEN